MNATALIQEIGRLVGIAEELEHDLERALAGSPVPGDPQPCPCCERAEKAQREARAAQGRLAWSSRVVSAAREAAAGERSVFDLRGEIRRYDELCEGRR